LSICSKANLTAAIRSSVPWLFRRLRSCQYHCCAGRERIV